MLTIEGTYAKSGKTRHIPLNFEALQVLKTWQKQTNSESLVFANKHAEPFDNVKKSWAGVLNLAKNKKFSLA